MPTHVCPACHKSFTYHRIKDHATYPFCSVRCQQAELGAWLDGRYAISRPVEEGEADAAPERPEDAACPPAPEETPDSSP